MKRVLIVSPHFPPANYPDMHRVRQSLPYFAEFGWEPVTLAVDSTYVEGAKDESLLATVPPEAEVRRVRALDPGRTRRVGLGNLALRAIPHLWREGTRLLAERDFDLVYFSTTQFPAVVLGPLWRRQFGVPYVVDMQDPWRSDHYLSVPRSERPPKFWFSYRLDQVLESVSMQAADGLVAVTEAYVETLRDRYPALAGVPSSVIPFGVSPRDYVAARDGGSTSVLPERRPDELRGVYTGVCNTAMLPVLRALFAVLAEGRRQRPDLFGPVRLHFVGTSYAPADRASPAVLPLAREAGVDDAVTEQTARVPFLSALRLQVESDFLLLPGTIDRDYTASKLYPYVFSRRPILAAFRESSSLVSILENTRAGVAATFAESPDEPAFREALLDEWASLLERLPFTPDTDWTAFEPYTARETTRQQTDLFDRVLARRAQT